MKLKMIALSAAMVASASANEMPQTQWKISPQQSLFDLVQAGYKIVAATDDPTRSLDVFVLQKDKSVFKCQEEQGTHSAVTMCFESVRPFAVPSLK